MSTLTSNINYTWIFLSFTLYPITETAPITRIVQSLDISHVHYLLYDIQCNGTEEVLSDCEYAAPGSLHCHHVDRAAVACM